MIKEIESRSFSFDDPDGPMHGVYAGVCLSDGTILTVPAIWRESELLANQKPEEVSAYFKALISNFLKTISDMNQEHFKEGAYADVKG